MMHKDNPTEWRLTAGETTGCDLSLAIQAERCDISRVPQGGLAEADAAIAKEVDAWRIVPGRLMKEDLRRVTKTSGRPVPVECGNICQRGWMPLGGAFTGRTERGGAGESASDVWKTDMRRQIRSENCLLAPLSAQGLSFEI